MDLIHAIEHARAQAGTDQCGEEHRQLAEWLEELLVLCARSKRTEARHRRYGAGHEYLDNDATDSCPWCMLAKAEGALKACEAFAEELADRCEKAEARAEEACQMLVDSDRWNTQLREALEPFAKFAEAWDKQPLRGIADEFFGIHTGTAWEANLSLQDCRIARAALGRGDAKTGGEK